MMWIMPGKRQWATGTEPELASTCLALIGQERGLSAAERNLAAKTPRLRLEKSKLETLREAIRKGADPLGEAFCALRSAAQRRASGAIYTPAPIVQFMMKWLADQGLPERVVDPGAGSGRFILAAARAFPDARLVAIEIDPLSALTLRANLSCHELNDRATVLVQDYRDTRLTADAGRTAFVGNPPYVRHHAIADGWKQWYRAKFADLGITASALAGLHLHFFLQTRRLARAGDYGALVTSAEWLDVNYGSALRQLFLAELGGIGLHVLAPTAEAFPGTATTAAISCFRVGEENAAVRVRSVASLPELNGMSQGLDVARQRLRAARRWSSIVGPALVESLEGVELGELFRVHRGQVTGANAVWIAGEQAAALPERVKLPTVTKAKELINAGAHLRSHEGLRRVIDLPPDLGAFDGDERGRINRFLAWAKQRGADQGYIAQHRKAWWSVGLREPAPILCTYMARRPPQFTLNTCAARHINIAHGLYPRVALPLATMVRLVEWLNHNIRAGSGRTYAGGLTKFEPGEIERLRIAHTDAAATD